MANDGPKESFLDSAKEYLIELVRAIHYRYVMITAKSVDFMHKMAKHSMGFASLIHLMHKVSPGF